mmetsp:Transcript_6691/g.25853  ORF Transcript_6691/g.25853 Transcript_6691/m.25853 type:complete len:238 (+) Transcript_6691:3548-4261(+)
MLQGGSGLLPRGVRELWLHVAGLSGRGARTSQRHARAHRQGRRLVADGGLPGRLLVRHRHHDQRGLRRHRPSDEDRPGHDHPTDDLRDVLPGHAHLHHGQELLPRVPRQRVRGQEAGGDHPKLPQGRRRRWPAERAAAERTPARRPRQVPELGAAVPVHSPRALWGSERGRVDRGRSAASGAPGAFEGRGGGVRKGQGAEAKALCAHFASRRCSRRRAVRLVYRRLRDALPEALRHG